MWNGSSGPWRGSLFTSLEGSNRTPCIVRWPGKVPAGRVSNELVHEVDLFTTLVLAGGGTVPADRQIDGMDMREFLLGDGEASGRDTVLCFNGNRLQAVKWRQWKVHLFQQDDFYSTWVPFSIPHLYNLEWDPREEHQVDFPHAWVMHPMAAAAGAYMKTLAIEPPIKPGTPDPYTPPAPGQLVPQEHLQIGPITQFVTTLHHPDGQNGSTHNGHKDIRQLQPEHGLSHASGG
jgi:arylsulfatase